MRLASLLLIFDYVILVFQLNDLSHDKSTSPNENHIVG